MATRRDLLKLGLAAGGSTFLPSRMALADRRELLKYLCPPDDQPRQINDQPPSPPAAPWVAELFVPPVMEPVQQLTPPPDPRAHQRYEEFLPQKLYEIHEREMQWQYHPDEPYTKYKAGTKDIEKVSWSWGFQAGGFAPSTPGPTYKARYGEPVLMYMDPPSNGMPGVGMDQSFFDMEEGTRTVFRIKMAPAAYFSLVYTWGWRMHPPRAQVMESAGKQVCYLPTSQTPCPTMTLDQPPPPPPGPMPAQSAGCPVEYWGMTLPQVEQAVFCPPENPGCTSVRCGPGEPRTFGNGQPTPCEQQKIYAISKLGDLAPEKRMWNAVRAAQQAAFHAIADEDWDAVSKLIDEKALPAYFDWLNRNQLPAGVKRDPDSDITLLYVNNSTYGELTNGSWGRWDSWEERTEPCPDDPAKKCPKTLKVTILNGDNFVHSYSIADFGGNRGWENQFRSSVKVAGSGCWFTFGRNWWWLTVGGPMNPYVCVAPTDGLTPGIHKVEVELNFDPSRRLRFYQFDPMHHDVAIYSVH